MTITRLAVNTAANTVTTVLSNAEILLCPALLLANANNAFGCPSNGDMVRFNLNATIPTSGPYFSVTVRIGPNGTAADNVIWTGNNIITLTQANNDLNVWAQTFPGSVPTNYTFPANAALLPVRPSQISGQLLVYFSNASTVANTVVATVVQPRSIANPLSAIELTSGVLGSNTINVQVNNFISVTGVLVPPVGVVFSGIAAGVVASPYNAFNVTLGANVAGSLLFGSSEIL